MRMAVSATALCGAGQAASCGILTTPSIPRGSRPGVVRHRFGAAQDQVVARSTEDAPRAPWSEEDLGSELAPLSEERVSEVEAADPDGSSQQELWIRRLRLMNIGGPTYSPETVDTRLRPPIVASLEDVVFAKPEDQKAYEADAGSEADARGLTSANLDEHAVKQLWGQEDSEADMWMQRLQLYTASTDPGPSSCNTSRAASHLSHITAFRADGEELKSTLTSLLSKTVPLMEDAEFDASGTSPLPEPTPEPQPPQAATASLWFAATATGIVAAGLLLLSLLLLLGARGAFFLSVGAPQIFPAELSWCSNASAPCGPSELSLLGSSFGAGSSGSNLSLLALAIDSMHRFCFPGVPGAAQ